METSVQLASDQTLTLGGEVNIQLPTKNYPLTITPKADIDALEWARTHKDEINELLLVHGAILMRGFDIEGAAKFNEFFAEVSGEAMEYKNRTSPRDRVYSNVYTSTSHPKDQVIHMHTENSYSDVYNRIIAFYCLVPAPVDGATPIADERKLLAYLKPETVKKFKERGVQYVRNTIPGIGLDWKTIYQTEDRNEVNKILDSKGYEYTWVDDEHLRVKWTLPAFIEHPSTGKELWFNHMFFGHKSHYNEAVLEFFAEEDLPFVTYYGDGQKIEDEVIQEFVDFYKEHSIVFKWEQNDFLLLDNLCFSHGRESFEGDRTILTAMGQPYKMG